MVVYDLVRLLALLSSSQEGAQLVTKLAEAVFSSAMIPVNWQESFILNLYKGKGEALDRGNHCGLKLTDQVMKVLERVLDYSICQMVNIDEMQFTFVSISYLVEIPLMPSSLFVSCRRSKWALLTNSSIFDGRSITQVDVKGAKLDVEATFSYLGDMLCSSGHCDSAIAARRCVAWGKFRKLLPQHLRPCHCLLHLSLSKDYDKIPPASLLQKLGINAVFHNGQLSWYGHVQHATSWLKSVTHLTLRGLWGKGRPRKTWSECVKTDISDCGQAGIDPQDRCLESQCLV